MEVNRIEVLLFDATENGDIEYAVNDLRSYVNKVAIAEVEGVGASMVRIPPGNVIKSVAVAGGVIEVKSSPYRPNEASLAAMGRKPLTEVLEDAIIAKPVDDRYLVELTCSEAVALVLCNCGSATGAEDNRKEFIRVFKLILEKAGY